MSYRFRAYGISILSDAPIAGLLPLEEPGFCKQLSFETGAEPPWAQLLLSGPSRPHTIRSEHPASVEPTFTLLEYGSGQGYGLNYSDGTRFLVDADAKRIWGTFTPPLTAEDLATYFLGPILGFVLRKRHVTSIHASTIQIGQHAVLLCGDAGAGKSTTAAALALRGVPVLGEDIAPLEDHDGVFCAIPGYPRVCLWPDAVTKLLGQESALPKLTEAWDKRYLALDGERAHFAHAPLPVGAIYLLQPRSEDAHAPLAQAMKPREALLELVQNTYMNWLLDREQRVIEFDALSRLVMSVPVRSLIPHADPERIGALCQLIQRDAISTLANVSARRSATDSESGR